MLSSSSSSSSFFTYPPSPPSPPSSLVLLILLFLLLLHLFHPFHFTPPIHPSIHLSTPPPPPPNEQQHTQTIFESLHVTGSFLGGGVRGQRQGEYCIMRWDEVRKKGGETYLFSTSFISPHLFIHLSISPHPIHLSHLINPIYLSIYPPMNSNTSIHLSTPLPPHEQQHTHSISESLHIGGFFYSGGGRRKRLKTSIVL